jgi:large subunit ribosomal protein L5
MAKNPKDQSQAAADKARGQADKAKAQADKAKAAEAKAKALTEPKGPVEPAPTPRMLIKYENEVLPKLRERFGITNRFALPRLAKIVVNMGVGKARENKAVLETAVADLTRITGQKPKITRAKKAISGFRLREGMPIGCCVTLRGKRMYEFLDRLISVAIPRIKDFRGLKRKAFDGRGNYSMGLSEQTVFPEIEVAKLTSIQGMDITMCSTAGEDAKAEALLEAFGMPFRDK